MQFSPDPKPNWLQAILSLGCILGAGIIFYLSHQVGNLEGQVATLTTELRDCGARK